MRSFRSFARYLLAAALVLAAAGLAQAEVNVNINLGPPPIVVAEPPAVVAIPQTRVYFAPDPHVDVFFYAGYWWSPRGPQWYRAKAYNGPWIVVEQYRVPKSVLYVPRDYRTRYVHERHVPYGQWKKEHAQWDREHRKSHKRWEKEREREWKEEQKREKQERHGNHGHDGNHGKGRGN
jgi:hypothetical protein